MFVSPVRLRWLAWATTERHGKTSLHFVYDFQSVKCLALVAFFIGARTPASNHFIFTMLDKYQSWMVIFDVVGYILTHFWYHFDISR